MLGELLAELTTRSTSIRVLPSEGPWPKVELSFQGSGKLLGVETSQLGTYWYVTRPDGTLVGEGQGLSVTRDGEVVTWKGQGIGKSTGHGIGLSWRGAVFFQTTHPKLARLNGVVAVFEYEADEGGNARGKFWEWK